MKSPFTLFIVLFTLGLIASQVTTLQAQDHDAMIAAASALDKEFAAAFNSGDVDKLASLYWNSPDLDFFPPGNLVDHGHEAVTANWKAFLEATPGAQIEILEPVHMVAGEYVVSHGLFVLKIPTPDGGMQEINGRFTDVTAERDGEWVYVHDHASVPLPPPPSEE